MKKRGKVKPPNITTAREANLSLPAERGKLILNPSRQTAYVDCKLRYHYLYNLFLNKPDLPVKQTDGQPLLGSLIHATHQAFDSGKDYTKVVDRVVRDLKKSIHYNVKYSVLVDQVIREALQIFRGGSVKDGRGKETKWASYPTWRNKMSGFVPADRADPDTTGPPVHVEVVDTEVRLMADVGPVVLAPKLDAVIRAHNVFGQDEETYWVEEHKSTARDDSQWRWRWEMDGQTTCQIVAAEHHYGIDFEGVLVNQIVVTRRKTDTPGRIPPINKVIRYDARWVSKKPEVRALYMNFLEDLALDFEDRSVRGAWVADGMMSRKCDLCHLRSICSGRESASVLQPYPPDDVQLEFERRAKKLKAAKRGGRT
jgi:hypothetical protein